MFNLQLPGRHWPIALEMGTESIKMLQMRKIGEELAVCACGRRTFPHSIRGDDQRRTDYAVTAVREILRSGKFRGKRAITALPSSEIAIKNIRLPHLPEHERIEAIMWEASERFDFDLTEDTLKYHHAGEVRQGTETQEEIILLAARKEALENHLAMIDRAGLRIEHIDPEPIALFRAFTRLMRRWGDDDNVSVIVDVGEQSTRVLVARGRQIVFIKNIDIAGRRLTEAVAKQLNLSLEEAADLRAMIAREHAECESPPPEQAESPQHGQASESVCWTIHDAVRGELEDLGREIALCLRYCSVTFRGLRPQSVTITGGQAYDPSVVRLLSEQLGIECVIGRPLRGINLSQVGFEGDRRGMLAEWAVCAGLAIRGVDFSDRDLHAEHERHRLPA